MTWTSSKDHFANSNESAGFTQPRSVHSIPIEKGTSAIPTLVVASRFVDESADDGIVRRMVGGTAIFLHSQNCDQLWSLAGRELPHDVDFMSRFKFCEKILKFFETRLFQTNQHCMTR